MDKYVCKPQDLDLQGGLATIQVAVFGPPRTLHRYAGFVHFEILTYMWPMTTLLNINRWINQPIMKYCPPIGPYKNRLAAIGRRNFFPKL